MQQWIKQLFILSTIVCASVIDATIHHYSPSHELNRSIASVDFDQANGTIDLSKFEKPFCMIGRGNPNLAFKKKLKILRRYQRKISRRSRNFKKNKKKETKATLHGSPKWVAIKHLRHKGFSWAEVDFAFFAMTLFGEARNLKSEDIEMVARVINNRRNGRSYRQTVTNLAQFSSWYYKNQRDNVKLLCPNTRYYKHWAKIIDVAKKHFFQEDQLLGSTHYFAPRNMVPRNRLPSWARGKYGARFGGHIFVFNKKEQTNVDKDKIFFIPKRAKKLGIRKGKIHF
jgi:hypothetical protein